MFLKKDREPLDKDFDDYDWLDDFSEGNLTVEPPEDSGSAVATDVAMLGGDVCVKYGDNGPTEL